MKIMKWTSLVMVFGILASCYPEKDRTIDDFDIVGTNYDDKKNFDDYTTFFLPDSVVLIYDTNDDKPDYPTKEAAVIIDAIRSNMLAYGWKEMTPSDTIGGKIPDVFMRTAVWSSTVSGTVYYPGYWGGGWYGGYYPGYPYYGGGYSYYSYSTGTVLIDMVDLVYPDTVEHQLDIIWTAAMNGILSSSGAGIDRVEYSVNQSFKQSAYLKKN